MMALTHPEGEAVRQGGAGRKEKLRMSFWGMLIKEKAVVDCARLCARDSTGSISCPSQHPHSFLSNYPTAPLPLAITAEHPAVLSMCCPGSAVSWRLTGGATKSFAVQRAAPGQPAQIQALPGHSPAHTLQQVTSLCHCFILLETGIY